MSDVTADSTAAETPQPQEETVTTPDEPTEVMNGIIYQINND